MKTTPTTALVLASLLASCGPRPGPEHGPGEGGITLECGGGGSLAPGTIDPGWSDETVLVPVAADCRWEGMPFRLYRRAPDGALFYRPLLKIVDAPEKDTFADPSGRTLSLALLTRVPDVEAACRMDEELALDGAEPMPLSLLRMRLEAPLKSEACEMGGSGPVFLADEEIVLVTFPDRSTVERVLDAFEKDPAKIGLRIYYELVGSVRETRCRVDEDEATGRHGLASLLREKGLEVDSNAVLYATAATRDRAVKTIEAELGDAIADFPPLACEASTRSTVASRLVDSWTTRTFKPGDAAHAVALSMANTEPGDERSLADACRKAVEAASGKEIAAKMGSDVTGFDLKSNFDAFAGSSVDCPEGPEVLEIEIGDLDASVIDPILASLAPLAPFADEIVMHAGTCSASCSGCCDERRDCASASDQDEQRCGTGAPGESCVQCTPDTICDGTCVTPPFMDAVYNVTLVSVEAWRCGLMEVGGCDLDVRYGLHSGSELHSISGPNNASSVDINAVLLKDADPDAAMEGFEVEIDERDPFANDFLGSCNVAVGKEHLVAAFRRKGAPVSEQECQKSTNLVHFKVELGPSYSP